MAAAVILENRKIAKIRCEQKSVEFRVFRRVVGHFERRFQREWASPTNHSWYQSSRVIALSCGIKISAVHHLVLSQRHACDRQTDGRTDGQTDRITTKKVT